MTILGWVLFGAIAGWLASILTGRNQRQGCFANIAVGVLGAFIGGALFRALGGAGVTGFNPWSMLVAVIGAVILLAIMEVISR